MNFWKKLFGTKNEQNEQATDSHFDRYKRELHAQNLTSVSDLENLLKPLLRRTTKLELLPASRSPENSQFLSHFGGQPYFETNEQWPTNKKGKHLDFIFQIFNAPEFELPDHIALIQFFYDWDEFPWDTEDDGWLVKIYHKIDQQKVQFIEKPHELEKSKFCTIDFKQIKTLPDWEGIDLYDFNASKLSSVLDEDDPWEHYEQVVEKLVGEQEYHSQLGGYPKWVQGESTPKDKAGNSLKLLFQIDSEDNAGLMWGDMGQVYVFYDETAENIEFILQCH